MGIPWIWIGTWVIIVVGLLIVWLVNVADSFTDILKHYILQTSAALKIEWVMEFLLFLYLLM